jgi:hypothetical protein
MKLISWNIAHRKEAWHRLLDTDADVALLQEAVEPPPEIPSETLPLYRSAPSGSA